MDKFVRRMEVLTYNHSEALNPGVMMRPSKQSTKHSGRGWSERYRFSCHQRARSHKGCWAEQCFPKCRASRIRFTSWRPWAIYQQLCQRHLSFVLFLFYVEQNKDQELLRDPFRSLWQNIVNWKTY